MADSRNGTYITVPAVDQEYAQGLTLFQHRVICRYARERIREQLDSDALRRAKAKLQSIIEREWMLTKRSRTRVKMARFRNVSNGDVAAEQRLEAPGPALPPPEREFGGIKLLPGVSSISDADAAAGSEPGAGADAGVISPEPVGKQSRRRRTGAKTPHKKATVTLRETVQDETSESAVAQAEELDLSGWGVDFDLP